MVIIWKNFYKLFENLFEDFPNKNYILKRINELPVTRNTVKDKIIAMAKDVTDHLIQDIRNAGMISFFLNKSTDVTTAAHLAVFAR